MRHGRKKDPWDKPWVAYAAFGGIAVVLVVAIVFFFGGGGGAAAPSGTGAAATVKSITNTQPAVSATVTKSSGISSTPLPTPTPVIVPSQGISVKVSYIGGFSGTYGVTGALVKVADSGDRVYTVDGTGTVTATIHKDDSSAKHALTVEIWKNGVVVKSGTTSSPNGEVSISYQM